MKKAPLFAVILLFYLFNPAYSQKLKKELKDRILAVELIQPDEKYASKLARKDSEKLEMYLQQVNEINTILKEDVSAYWKLNDQVVFLTTEEIHTIFDEKNPDYLVFVTGSCETKVRSGTSHARDNTGTNPGRIVTSTDVSSEDAYTYGICLPEKHEKAWSKRYATMEGYHFENSHFEQNSKFYYQFSFPEKSLNRVTTKAVCDLYYNYFKESSRYNVLNSIDLYSNLLGKGKSDEFPNQLSFMNGDQKALMNDTLLLDRKKLGYLEENMEELYKYPYKFVTSDDINELVLNQKSGYIYVKPAWFVNQFGYFLFKTENHELVSYLSAMGYTKEKDIKRLIKRIEEDDDL